MKLISTGSGNREKFWVKEGIILRQISREEYGRLLDEARAALPQVSPPEEILEGNRPWSKPILSDALAVHPSQIAQVMDRNRAQGLEVSYEAESGRPILISRDQRRRLMKIEGCHDNQGGYGDG